MYDFSLWSAKDILKKIDIVLYCTVLDWIVLYAANPFEDRIVLNQYSFYIRFDNPSHI